MARSRPLRSLLPLGAITLLGLALRMLLWHWRELQPLGGDEQEYLNAALTLLRDRRYVELLFMRPPLYPIALASWILVVDSLVQNLRLVQALVSTATIPLVSLLSLEVAQVVGSPAPVARRATLLAALLAALSYTLAANATELLAETLFLFGLSGGLWLLVRAGRLGSLRLTALAGLALGALSLVRAVALPLVPLGAVWLLINAAARQPAPGLPARAARHLGAFLVAWSLVVLPWTARNYLVYGGFILVDTTGAENLWLDNDPAGREAVKAQLFALGEDRLQRQQLAARNGLAVIRADPARFVGKARGELLRFFALEYADDMRARPQIWVRPADVWLRLIFGDGLWLLLLLTGSYGLARGLLADSTAPAAPDGRGACVWRSALRVLGSPAWLLAPWALYVLLTTLIFHVELRYRLPLFPALLPYAGLTLVGGVATTGNRRRTMVALLVPALALSLTLLHVNYLALGWQLGAKHWHLGRAEAALARDDSAAARQAALAALARDPGSALARIALARAALLDGDLPDALAQLDEAVGALPDHPQAHVLRGDVRRALGDTTGARSDLAYERASLQDLQGWLWAHGISPAPARLALGAGLDLGFIRNFHGVRPGEEGYRWTRDQARLRMGGMAGAQGLRLRLASGRPADSNPVTVELRVNGTAVGTLLVGPAWTEYDVALPPAVLTGDDLMLELQAPTFRPRQFDPASPDGRSLGVKLARVEGVRTGMLNRDEGHGIDPHAALVVAGERADADQCGTGLKGVGAEIDPPVAFTLCVGHDKALAIAVSNKVAHLF